MRPTGIAACGLAALLCTVLASPGARADGQWSGELRCGPVAGHFGPLRIDMHLSQSGTALSYHRQIRTTTGGLTEGLESGSGTLIGGKVDLTGQFNTRGVVSDVHYRGTVTGAEMRLTGEQVWTWQRENVPIHRECRARLTHG